MRAMRAGEIFAGLNRLEASLWSKIVDNVCGAVTFDHKALCLSRRVLSSGAASSPASEIGRCLRT